MSNGRSVGVIAASIVGLVAVAVVIVLLADRRAPQEFAPGSPEATIQAYLEAWDRGELETAYALFSKGVQSRMSIERFERAASQWRANRGSVSNAVLISRSTVGGTGATVVVIVETSYGGGLANNTYREERDLRLALEGGAWRLADALVWLDPIDFYEVVE